MIHPPIIGVNGNARAGKDTVADYLVKKYGFVKIAFADPIKRIAQQLYDFSDEQLWGNSDEKEKPDFRYPLSGRGHLTPRVVLQVIGTEVGRTLYPETWVRKGLEAADAVLAGTHTYHQKYGLTPISFFRRKFGKATRPKGVVISDIRFKNEIAALQSRKSGFVCRVNRPVVTSKGVGLLGHPSESEQKSISDWEFDYVINNNQTLDILYVNVEVMMRKFKKGERLRMVA